MPDDDSAPPVAPAVYFPPAPTMNLFLRSGVPFVPSHNAQPNGVFVPDHITIVPRGKIPCTNAVVASPVELSEPGNVVARAEPVNVALCNTSDPQ